MNKPFFIIIASLVFALLACKKDSFITSPEANIILSSDSLYFDTVFTTTGSVTQGIKIINNNDQKLKLATVSLAGGLASPFKLNIDGAAVPQMNDIEIEAKDSIYVFVIASINQSTNNLPFIVQDSILLSYNGNKRYIKLSAWGQNAHFLKNKIIDANTTWTNDLPYVILGGLQVKENATLSIEKGVRVYAHADAPILVDGTLKVTGEKYDSMRVVFASDRLDDPYRAYPGSWPGIYFRQTSKNNALQYATIKNAYQGIVLQQPNAVAVPNVMLDECIIDNISDAGIIATKSSLTANNCLISNCGKNVFVQYGGDYKFTHCTIAAISNSYVPHLSAGVWLSDAYTQDGTTQTGDLNASFINCIVWAEGGSIADEVIVSKQGNSTFAVNFTSCLWKVTTTPENVTATNVFNEPPAFDSIDASKHFYNFRLKDISPAINKGVPTTLAYDLDGNPRSVNAPDLGAYERQ